MKGTNKGRKIASNQWHDEERDGARKERAAKEVEAKEGGGEDAGGGRVCFSLSFPIEITVMCFSEGTMEDAGSRRVQPLARPRSQLGALSGLIRASRGPRRPQRFSHQGA